MYLYRRPNDNLIISNEFGFGNGSTNCYSFSKTTRRSLENAIDLNEHEITCCVFICAFWMCVKWRINCVTDADNQILCSRRRDVESTEWTDRPTLSNIANRCGGSNRYDCRYRNGLRWLPGFDNADKPLCVLPKVSEYIYTSTSVVADTECVFVGCFLGGQTTRWSTEAKREERSRAKTSNSSASALRFVVVFLVVEVQPQCLFSICVFVDVIVILIFVRLWFVSLEWS